MRFTQPALLKAVMCRNAVVCGTRDPMHADVTELRAPVFSRMYRSRSKSQLGSPNKLEANVVGRSPRLQYNHLATARRDS
jgi:hypothetical protein